MQRLKQQEVPCPTHGALTFLDLLAGRQRGPVGAHWQHCWRGDFGRRQHGGGPVGRVGEEGTAEALPPALAPVAVDGCLELVGVAQTPLVTFIRVQVLHVSVERNQDKINNIKTQLYKRVMNTGCSKDR